MTVRFDRLFVLLVFTICACSKKPADEFRDLQPFQGAWDVVAFNDAGEQAGPDKLAQMSVVVENQNLRLFVEGTVVLDLVLRLPSSAIPGEIDLVPLAGANPGQPQPALYAFEQDQLKLCVANFDQPRPTALEVQPGTNWGLLVLKRKP